MAIVSIHFWYSNDVRMNINDFRDEKLLKNVGMVAWQVVVSAVAGLAPQPATSRRAPTLDLPGTIARPAVAAAHAGDRLAAG